MIQGAAAVLRMLLWRTERVSGPCGPLFPLLPTRRRRPGRAPLSFRYHHSSAIERSNLKGALNPVHVGAAQVSHDFGQFLGVLGGGVETLVDLCRCSPLQHPR